jgi:uncharacterized protein
LLSVTAGVCEEILYRGWLVQLFLAGVGSIWLAVPAAAALFGVAHCYEGRRGMAVSAIGGVALGALFVLTGSLLPGQVLHALMDVASGIMGKLAIAGLRCSGS